MGFSEYLQARLTGTIADIKEAKIPGITAGTNPALDFDLLATGFGMQEFLNARFHYSTSMRKFVTAPAMKSHDCPLCGQPSTVFAQLKQGIYHQCPNCAGIFLDAAYRLGAEEEEARYQEHNNDVEDPRYQHFVAPVTSAICTDFSPQHQGLDFGAGTGPVISKILHDRHYQIAQYDPFFHPYPALLTEQYDYIACCEVMEHFFSPYQEFFRLQGLLRPQGKLYCVTDLYTQGLDFQSWYYKNDPTHVFFYQQRTLDWIKEAFCFASLRVEGRLLVFSR
jgi:ribosomal protein L37AE/L43A